ncbi:flavin reductase family protein [Sphingobium chlorophenolicum]|nr:flavin reductase family protein [Sphingobium chlorophenolicum]
MRRLPSAVSLITARDPETGLSAGLVASAVIPVSMEPPSMLISINRNASAHKVIVRAGKFCVNLLSIEQVELVRTFADSKKRSQRFAGSGWSGAETHPYLPAACGNIFCETRTTIVFGTHEVFIGEVCDVRDSHCSGDPMCWVEGDFARATPL